MKINFGKWHPPPKKKTLMEFSKHKLQHNDAHMWERHTWRLCLPDGTAKINITDSCAQLGGPRLSPQPRLHAGEGHMLGRPERQVAAVPAGWARSNQGCGAQPELPTSARLAHGWLKAKFHSACTWEWPWGELKTLRLINTKEIRPLLRLTSNGLYTRKEKIPLLYHRCHLFLAVAPSWINH